jgi:hypothetical protein
VTGHRPIDVRASRATYGHRVAWGDRDGGIRVPTSLSAGAPYRRPGTRRRIARPVSPLSAPVSACQRIVSGPLTGDRRPVSALPAAFSAGSAVLSPTMPVSGLSAPVSELSAGCQRRISAASSRERHLSARCRWRSGHERGGHATRLPRTVTARLDAARPRAPPSIGARRGA